MKGLYCNRLFLTEYFQVSSFVIEEYIKNIIGNYIIILKGQNNLFIYIHVYIYLQQLFYIFNRYSYEVKGVLRGSNICDLFPVYTKVAREILIRSSYFTLLTTAAEKNITFHIYQYP